MPPADRGLSERVREKLETLPAQPGVYVFRGARDVVLYVGKARSLRSRVRSYFQPGTSDVRAFVRDGTLFTGNGPGACFELALALVEALMGRERAASVRAPMMLAG